jgi:hypothetical protein
MLKTAAAVGAALISLAAASSAQAGIIPTNVQVSTTGTGVYDVTGINQFDWQSSGDLVVKQTLVSGSVDGTNYTSFSAWVAAANAALTANPSDTSTATINIFAHARLNDMLDTGGGSIAPATLDKNGAVGGDAGFEITAALDAAETIKMVAVNTLQFISITGTYTFFFDTTPDSVVTTGAGFTDGVNMLTGAVTDTSGTATIDPATGKFSGNSLLTNTVTAYNALYIQTDPASNAPLVGTTFDTLLKLPNLPLEAVVGVGGVDGLVPPGGAGGTTVATGDLVLKADANSQFQGTSVPEPGTITLMGAALMGLAGSARRKRSS